MQMEIMKQFEFVFGQQMCKVFFVMKLKGTIQGRLCSERVAIKKANVKVHEMPAEK